MALKRNEGNEELAPAADVQQQARPIDAEAARISVDGDKLTQQIRTWLAGQGFPLEMRTAQSFHKAGFFVEQSRYYATDGGVSREIDICANLETHWAFQGNDQDGLLVLEMFVVTECKSAAKSVRPWIVFSSPHHPFDENGPALARLGTPIAKAALDLICNDPLAMDTELFRLRDRYGYAVSCAPVWEPRSNDDLAFAAITSLADAAAAHTDPILDGLYRHCRITLPLLVVGTPLFECWLDEHGAMQLEPRSHLTIIWRRAVKPETPYMLIDIVHESGINAYVESVKSAFVHVIHHHKRDVETARAAVDRHAPRKSSPGS